MIAFYIRPHFHFPVNNCSFIAIHPISVNLDGETRLAYSWGVENGAASLSWLGGDSPGADGKQLSIDRQGAILDASNVQEDAQLEASQGNAWRLVLQPLPTAGQNTWTAQRPIKLIDSRRGLSPFGGMPFGGPFGGGPFGGGGPVPGDVEATEKITYAAQPPVGNQMTVTRQYDLATPQDAGDRYEHIHGDGQYVFDVRHGRVASLEWKLSADVKNGTVPVTVDARLITPKELAMLKDAADAEIAAQKKAKDAELAKIKAQGRLTDDEAIADYTNLPDGMIRTQMLGAGNGGGTFVIASADRKPVIGFRIKIGEWFGHSCFNVLEPLYAKPTAGPEDRVTLLLARDGYAVGGMTVNAGESAYAACVTFMKMSPTGLDSSTAYTSPWYGKRSGASNTKLDAKGGFVYGICGRRGLNVDAIGLIKAAPPGTDSHAVEADRNAALAERMAARTKSEAQASAVVAAQGMLPPNEQLTDPNNLPAEMLKTDIMGTTQGGWPFAVASMDHKPVVGFQIRLGNWMGRACFSALDPLYSKPTAPRESGMIRLIAKDGYAVGSVTVNAGEFLNALCIRFMKIKGAGLDPSDSYVTQWFGKKVGTSQTKLDGKGAFVYGICGRRGLDVDALGLIIAAPVTAAPADDGNKP